MKVHTTAPLEDPRDARATFSRLEEIGYDGGFTFEAKLEYRGEIYRHTLMIPAFDPGPNPFGPPPVFTAGFGPRMTEVAGEVSDGVIAHSFSSRRSLLDIHGWGRPHSELNRLSKEGRRDEMAGCIDDEVLEEIAVVGPRCEIADRLRTRLEGIADGASLTHNRAPDPDHRADVVADLKRNG